MATDWSGYQPSPQPSAFSSLRRANSRIEKSAGMLLAKDRPSSSHMIPTPLGTIQLLGEPSFHVIGDDLPVAGLAVQAPLAVGSGFKTFQRLQDGQERIIIHFLGNGLQAFEQLRQVLCQGLPPTAGRANALGLESIAAGQPFVL